MSNKLKLTSLNIEKSFNDDRPYKCRIRVEGAYSSTELQLTDEQADRVVACVSDLVVESAREIAELLTTESMGFKLLTNGDPEEPRDESQ